MTRDFGTKGPLLWQFRDIQTLKADQDYNSAKAGDLEAAVRLVLRCVDADLLKKARQEFGRDAVYVSVHAEEAQGKMLGRWC